MIRNRFDFYWRWLGWYNGVAVFNFLGIPRIVIVASPM